MATVQAEFTQSVEDINKTVRRTNTLLRAVNAVRHAYVDLKQLIEEPNVARLMWTLVQISRAYTALRRLYRLVSVEMNKATSFLDLLARTTVPPPVKGIEEPGIVLDFPLSVKVEAYMQGKPMKLEGVDLTELPKNTSTMLDAILEEDAEQTVEDARRVLDERIASYTSPYSPAGRVTTGYLRDSIGWRKHLSGTRITAEAPYAWWVEEGQRTFEGHHYMKTAVDYARLRLPEKIRLEVNGLLFNEIT